MGARRKILDASGRIEGASDVCCGELLVLKQDLIHELLSFALGCATIVAGAHVVNRVHLLLRGADRRSFKVERLLDLVCG